MLSPIFAVQPQWLSHILCKICRIHSGDCSTYLEKKQLLIHNPIIRTGKLTPPRSNWIQKARYNLNTLASEKRTPQVEAGILDTKIKEKASLVTFGKDVMGILQKNQYGIYN